ncbi:MAG: hypothetical protein H0T47_22825 [Planctomycetaceae bacterium]|nr:hypothetical protein [Planctomycetaceae bacterium]
MSDLRQIATSLWPLWVLLVALEGSLAAGVREEIWQVLAQRQEAAHTASVAWQKESLVAGSTQPPDEHGNRQEDLALPRHPCTLIVSGNQARFETQIASFANKHRGVLIPHIDAFDGTNKQTFSDGTSGPWGVIQESDSFEEWRNVNLYGLTLNLRPLRPEAFGTIPSDWNVEDRPAVVDGRACVVLTRPVEKAIYHAYFDRNAGDLLMRYEKTFVGRVASRTDMRYDSMMEPPWLPVSWVTTFGSDRSVNEVEQVSLGIEVPDATFKIEYPAGTRISVLGSPRDAAKRGGVVSEKMFIVGEKGSLVPRRKVIAEETKNPEWALWPWTLAGIGVVVLAAALLLRRRRSEAE